MPKGLQVWAAQIRAPFLLLSVFLVLIGGAAAYRDGTFMQLRFGLAMLGIVLAHVAVNLFNELSDHRTGIDLHTRRTPFSGGSGNLQQGATTPRAVRVAAFAALLGAFFSGLYLAWVAGWPVLAFMLAGGLVILFYSTHLARWGLGELMAGLCLGTFVVLGTYYVQARTLTGSVVWLSLTPGILTSLLLLLNEFPDAEADRRGGRAHLVILLGWRNAARVYTAALAGSYALLGLGVVLGRLPATVLLAFLTLPLAYRSARTAWQHGSEWERMLPALAANVGVVLGTDLLLALGYFLG